ncbi:MAG: non-canonical purine NTP diphosphatase [Bacteroidota bacterium]
MQFKDLVFATSNAHKVSEVRQLLGPGIHLRSLADIQCTEEVPETQSTIEGNAIQKAEYVFDNYQVDCFAEDTGLEVEALNGEPGVYSARYAGPARDAQANMQKLLDQLKGHSNRNARFKTVIALRTKGHLHTFEGIIQGKIIEAPSGKGGFGYDPIFQPDGYDMTFANMAAEEKNRISHRGRAMAKLIAFLKEQSAQV